MSSLQFLNLKSFHPGNKQNQKKLYLAEEREKENKRREEERAKEVLQEQEFIKNRALLSGSKLEADRSKVGFLYTLPANLQQQQQQKENNKNDKDLKDSEKFPILANAPVEGLLSSDVKLIHKPFGIELRNVKCARCHNWGHKSGDRECPLVDINPNDLKRLQSEDPLSNYHKQQQQQHQQHNSDSIGSNNLEYKNKFRLNSNALSPKNYGGSNRNYQYEDILDDYQNNSNNNQNDDSDDDDDQVEREFLASLTKKQRKLLLKQIKLEEKQAKKKKKREREKEKQRERDKYKSRQSSSDRKSDHYSSDSDSSDGYSDISDKDNNRRKRHKSKKASSSSNVSRDKDRSSKRSETSGINSKHYHNDGQYEERVV